MSNQDGTTAIPVSPVPTESEMNSFRSMLDRALNAIVQASALAKQVEELSKSIEDMKHEVEAVRNNNRWLDEQLHTVRQQRDEAIAQAAQVKDELVQVKNDLANRNYENDKLNAQVRQLTNELDQARRERDDYGMKHMECSEALDKANAKLAKFRELLGQGEEPKAMPQGQPVQEPAKPDSKPLQEAPAYSTGPAAPAWWEKDDKPTPTKPYDPSTAF